MQSGTKGTGCPNNSDRRGVIGAKVQKWNLLEYNLKDIKKIPNENLASYPPLGRPRCEDKRTFAPLLVRYLIVGMAPLMRVSSVILPVPFSNGTLKSARTKTLFPRRSSSVKSPTDFFASNSVEVCTVSTWYHKITNVTAKKDFEFYSHMRLLLKAETAAALKRTRAMISACMIQLQTMANFMATLHHSQVTYVPHHLTRANRSKNKLQKCYL